MRKLCNKWTFAAAVAVCFAGLAGSAVSQTGAYVEIRTYVDGAGNVIGARYISHGCADPQPAGWGVWAGQFSIARGRCFVIAPPGGGEVN